VPRAFPGEEDEKEIDDADDWDAGSSSSMLSVVRSWGDDVDGVEEVEMERRSRDVIEQSVVRPLGMETSAMISLEQLHRAQGRETSQLRPLSELRSIAPPPPPLEVPPAADEPVLREPDTRAWKAVERCGPVWRWTVIAVLVLLALATALLWFVR